MVQLDGLSHRVLRQAIESGLAPTMARWLREGSHRLAPWWSPVPSTTPSVQAGVLYGSGQQVPAFRWWDKGLGRLVVTNRPQDAAAIESRLSDGNGLLAHGGAAISTMFSGDAPTRLLVMSSAGGGGGLGPGPSFLRFFASPFVLARALSRSVVEMVKELYQGRRQRIRQVEPRVPRRGWYVVLRGVTNVLLRDVNVSLVAEHLVRGTPSIYVNLVDYDEIAHHAGPSRPESLRALEGLDGVLALLEGSRRSPLVTTASWCSRTTGRAWGPRSSRARAPTSPRYAGGWCPYRIPSPWRRRPRSRGGRSTPSSRPCSTQAPHAGRSSSGRTGTSRGDGATPPELVVIASGSLALLWFPREPGE